MIGYDFASSVNLYNAQSKIYEFYTIMNMGGGGAFFSLLGQLQF